MATRKKTAARPILSLDDLDAAGIGLGWQPMVPAQEVAPVAPVDPEQDGPMARGVKQVSASVGLAGRLAARDFDGAAKNISDQAAYRAANPGSEEAQGLMRAWQQGDGILGGIKGVAGEFADDYKRADGVGAGVMSVGRNLQAMGSSLVEQVPNMALPMAGMIGGGAAGSAAAGPIGTVAGGWAGASAGNALVGTSEAAFRQLEKAGVNPSDAAAVREYLANNGDAILGETAIKGGVIGAVDVATAGLAHWLLSGPGKMATTKALTEMGVDMADKAAVKAATKTPVFKNLIANDATYQATQVGAQKLLRNTGAAATEPIGEFAGEYGGSLAATGEADAKDAFLEAASSLGQSGIMFAGQKAIQAIKSPSQAAADQIRATEKLPESGALTKAMNAGVEAKAQAVEVGGLQLAPLVVEQTATTPNGLTLEPLPGESAPEPVDDPVRDQILALPDGARQDALRAYAVLNRPDAAKGVLQYNRKLLDRLLAENQPKPVLGDRLTDTDMGAMLGGGGMMGSADPLAGALGMNREAQANSITNVAQAAENRPPMPASDAIRMLDEARNQGVDLDVTEHPAGGFVLVPPNWVTPDMAAQGEARLNETIARMQQADAAPVERAPRTRTEPVDLSLPTDPVQNYVGNLRQVNTPAAQAFVRDFDAGRITPADVQQRMTAEQAKTPDQRIAQAAAEAPAQADPVAERLRQAVSQSATVAPTDILNPSGLPFKTKMAANLAAKKTPGDVVPVEGGFVVRPQEPVNVQDVPQAPEVPQAAPAISQPAQAPQAVGAQPASPAAGVPAEGAGAVEAAGVSGEFADLFDEQGRPKFPNAQSVKDFKERTGLGQAGVRAIQAAIQEGRPITVDEARQADLAGQERRKAALEQSKAESEAEAQAAKQNSAKPTEPSKVLGDYEIPGIEGATNRVRVLQRGGRIEAIGLDEGTANNDLSRLIQSGQTVEQALATLYGDHGHNEAPNPSRVKRAGQPTSAAAPAAAAGLTDGAPTENTGAQAAPAAGAQAQAQAAAPAQTRLGRNNTPLSEGGKPFKTRKAAGDAKKLQPMMRVVTVPGGYALAEKTPAQLAAEERASRRLRNPNTSAPGEPIPAHAFIAAAGGLSRAAAADMGVDGNPRIGNRTLFAGQGRGLSMEQATQILIQDGYLGEGASINDALALIKTSLTRPQYNADGIERIAEAEVQAQFEDYLAAQEESGSEVDPWDDAPATATDDFSDDMLEASGYDAATDAIKAEVRALLEMANAQGIDTESIMLDAHERTRNATEQDYYEAAKTALEAAITGSNRDRSTPAGSESQGQGQERDAANQELNQPETVTSQAQAATESVAPGTLELAAQTPAEAAALQDAQEQAANAEAAAKRAADAAAAKEEDRKRIAQASVRAADRFELGQDPLDSLTGQGSMFDDAPEQPKQAPEATKSTAQPITRADVTAAQQQAATLIGERIDAMTAGEVNTIARRFLPTMGVKPTVSKERNKAAVTDFTKVNPVAAAAEFGVTLPADVRRALDAEMQGKVAMFSRSPSTKSAYEARIDALFAGEKAGTGTRVLDRSDMMGFLGFQNAPLLLDERHLLDNQTSHPEMTAEQWKKVPQWLDNPVVAYEDRGRIVMIAPETVAGYPVRMVIEPSPTAAKRGQAESFQLLVTVFAKTTQPHVPNLQALADSGSLRYLDTKTAPEIWKRAGAKFPRQVSDLRSRTKILTEKQFDGYRRANNPAAFMGQPTPPADSNARNAATQLLVDGLKAKWTRAPEIIVARNMQDAKIPQAVRDYDLELKSQGATGEPRGFIYKGKVYLLTDQLKGPQQIAEVLFHEVLGHYGLRGAFGDSLNSILQQMGTMRRKDVVAKAREYGLFNKDALGGLDKAAASDSQIWAAMSNKQRLDAAEEVLAEMAQTKPELGYVKRAIAAIRNWLRANVPGFKSLKLTDADIVQAYILPARGYVTRSNETAQQAIDRAMTDVGFSRTAGDLTQTENFRRWFAGSKAVDADGKPLVVYHGTGGDFSAFDPQAAPKSYRSDAGKQFFTDSPDVASEYAQDAGSGANVMPVYLSMKNPRVEETEGSPADWWDANGDDLFWRLDVEGSGHDGVIVRGPDSTMYVTSNPNKIKSAIGNNGNFDPNDPDIRFSRTTAQSIASSMGDMTPDQEKAYKNVAGVKAVPTVRERMDALKANLGLKLRQGLVDQFAAIKQLDQNAYVQARMSKGTDGTLEAMLMYGKPFMRDGAPDVDVKDGGFAKVLASLKGEQDRWMMWIAAQRAEKLKAEGKENLMTDDDISALKTLNAGRMADGTARTPVYAKALAELNEYNDAMLKLAMDSGLIDQDAYDLMAGQPYVPFYRLMEDGDMKGPKFSSGLTNQKAWQKLKGGTQQLNADLLQNMLLNWSHLLQASAKNRAATATMDAAEKMAVAYKVAADTKGAVKVMRDGSAEHWMVEDPYLLDAISAIHYVPSPLMKPLAKFKQLLTWGVTVNPTFKIRNLIRDSVSAIAQSELGYNPGANVAKGWKLTAKDSQIYASMLASGGLIKFGTQENTDRLRAQVAKLGGVVLDKSGTERFFGQIKDLYDVYNEFGDRAENVNRAALYDALIKKGKTHAEAAFMARDLMDFSMGGSAPVVRFLTQTVPFLNARLVGLDKLGRAAIEDPRRFAAVSGAVALASLALMAAYSDDEDWKKREDWDRDAYWWFKIGGQAYRIPKPFEVGAIGTLAERTAELMLNDEMTGKRYMERVSHMLSGTFSFNPVPQAFKPLLDLYANKDSFTGRAIESQADQRLRPQDRYGERTPEVAKFLGGLGLPDPAQLVKGEYSALSPKQVEHLIRGYFSWVGTAAMTVSDFGLRPLAGRGERPDMRLKDVFIAGNFVENLPTGSSRYVTQMYEQSRQAEQAYASYQEAIKAGDTEKAQSIKESAGPLLRNRPAYTAATRQLAEINRTARRIEADQAMAGAAKRARLTQLEQQRHVIAQRVSRLAAATP